MSLWEKWEKEKLKQQGVKVEHSSGVKIQDMHPKPNLRKQSAIVLWALLACLLAVYFALILNAMYGGYWNETYIVRYIMERAQIRQTQSSNQ